MLVILAPGKVNPVNIQLLVMEIFSAWERVETKANNKNHWF